MPNNFDQSAIEDTVGDVIRGLGVSANVYPNRPRSSSADLKDFVVCKITGNITDLRAFGTCTLSVHLFARDIANGKNRDKLSIMQRTLIEGMPRSVENLLIDDVPTVVGDTPDKNGYHARIINYSLILKVV